MYRNEYEDEQAICEAEQRAEWESLSMLQKMKHRVQLFLLFEKVYINKALIVRVLGPRMTWREQKVELEFGFKKRSFHFQLVVAQQPILDISYNEDIPF